MSAANAEARLHAVLTVELLAALVELDDADEAAPAGVPPPQSGQPVVLAAPIPQPAAA